MENIVTGKLYMRRIRNETILRFFTGKLLNGEPRWFREVAVSNGDGTFHAGDGEWAECMKFPEDVTGSGDRVTNCLATDEDLIEVLEHWKPLDTREELIQSSDVGDWIDWLEQDSKFVALEQSEIVRIKALYRPTVADALNFPYTVIECDEVWRHLDYLVDGLNGDRYSEIVVPGCEVRRHQHVLDCDNSFVTIDSFWYDGRAAFMYVSRGDCEDTYCEDYFVCDNQACNQLRRTMLYSICEYLDSCDKDADHDLNVAVAHID